MIPKVIISDVLDLFINSIDFKQTILSFWDNGLDETTLKVEDVFHSFKKRIVKIDNVEYTITSVDYINNTVTVNGLIVNPLIYDVGSPVFIHGVSRMVTDKVNKLVLKNQTPFIYLVEGDLAEDSHEHKNKYKTIENITLFFIANSGIKSSKGFEEAEFHTEEIIRPLKNLYFKIANEMLNYPNFGIKELGNKNKFKRRNLVGFGDIYKGRGKNSDRAVFDADLDGLGLSVALPISSDCGCC